MTNVIFTGAQLAKISQARGELPIPAQDKFTRRVLELLEPIKWTVSDITLEKTIQLAREYIRSIDCQ